MSLRIVDTYVPGDRAQTHGRTSSSRWLALVNDKVIERASTKHDLLISLVMRALHSDGAVWMSSTENRRGKRSAHLCLDSRGDRTVEVSLSLLQRLETEKEIEMQEAANGSDIEWILR